MSGSVFTAGQVSTSRGCLGQGLCSGLRVGTKVKNQYLRMATHPAQESLAQLCADWRSGKGYSAGTDSDEMGGPGVSGVVCVNKRACMAEESHIGGTLTQGILCSSTEHLQPVVVECVDQRCRGALPTLLCLW